MDGAGSSSAGDGGDYDDEPVLKYQRMGADVGSLLSAAEDAGEEEKETVVRMAVHDTCLVFGTATGTVLLTDYHGNETRRMRPHKKAVTDLSMDITGDFLASCSEDGTVVVNGLQPGPNGEQPPPEVYSYSAKWPMLAVKLDPLYARRKDKTFVAGGAAGKLLLNKKGWLGHDEIVLHKGEGPVSAIAWRGPLVAWASDGGLKIMDVDKGKGGERISYIDKPRSLVDFKEHECRCHMLWETPTRLLVGWGDTVMILQILVREPNYRSSGSLSPERQNQQHHHHHSPPGAAGGHGNASVNSRRTSVPLTNPIGGGLPMAVIGAPTASAPASLEAPERYTQIVAVWQSDCLVCGLSPFDSDTLILLGYPVEEEEEEEEEEGEGEGEGEEVDREERLKVWGGARGLFQPEVQLVKRRNGEVVSADTVPLRGWESAAAGQLLLRSSCWSTSSFRPDKEGATTVYYAPAVAEATGVRGLPPASFVMAPGDLIVARVRDIDDKVSWALGKGDFSGAVAVAMEQRHLLRQHDFQDIVAKHLEDLMSRGEFDRAASECPRLLVGDAMAWERWIYGFARRRRLSAVVPFVPTAEPRLPPSVYEVVLEHLMLTEPQLFLQTLRRWGHPRGKHGGQHGGRATAGRIAPGERSAGGRAGGAKPDAPPEAQQELYSLPLMMARMEASLVRKPDPIIMEAHAEAYVMDRQFARAIRAYLALAEHRPASEGGPAGSQEQQQGPGRSKEKDRAAAAAAAEAGSREPRAVSSLGAGAGRGGAGAGAGAGEEGQYAHVFRMIEQHSLFDTVQDRVMQLIRLDRELTGELLLRHPEKFSVASVVAQLKGRRDLQHWYLGLLFARSPEMYGAQEYAPFHALQVSLLAEFAAPFERGRPPAYNSTFLRFLRDSGFAPLEVALRECGKRRPPLYDEMAYILGRMGDTRRALTILLEEVCSVPRAIEFVEAHDKDLWYRLIEHSLKNEAFLSGLLDHAGVYDVDLARLVAEIPKGMHIPGLRDKVVKIISDYHFQVSVNESCSASVKTDLLRRLRRLNQGQRRATRVEAGARCSYGLCLMPLAGPPRGAPLGSRPPTAGRGWGRERPRGVAPARGGGSGGVSAGRGAGAYMFPCGHMYHEYCMGVAREKGGSKGKRGGNREGSTGSVVCLLCSGRGKSGKR
eukprot:g5557.t1